MSAPRTPGFSVSGRLTRMNLLVSGAALLLACFAFLSYDVYNFRDILIRNLAAQAQIIGANSVSALTFNDPQAAKATLSALKDSPSILSAGIFTPDGHIFAEYSRTHEMTLKVPTIPSGATEAHVFYPSEVVFVHAINFQGQTLGVVYLRSDLREIQKRFLRYLWIAAVVLVLSMLAALLVSAGFRRSVAAPIISLAETARSISQSENYGLRVDINQRFSEIATLDAAFNEMLTQNTAPRYRPAYRAAAAGAARRRTHATTCRGKSRAGKFCVFGLARSAKSPRHSEQLHLFVAEAVRKPARRPGQ